ncbi:MAG: hypothetical protein MI924_11240 [Chloroflexales bacterium]|nr:hypothetical protein [Chloroflexales bacterium]
MFDGSNRQIPIWLWGVLLAAFLIFLSARGRLPTDNPALQQHFASQPAAASPDLALPQLDLSSLPSEIQSVAQNVQRQLGMGQSVPALTPVAQNQRLRVEVSAVQLTAEGVRISGTVTNISTTDLQVPIQAFELRDSTGTLYATSGNAQVRLAPGTDTPLDLTIPMPEGRGLMLRLNFPPDPPIEQILLVGN